MQKIQYLLELKMNDPPWGVHSLLYFAYTCVRNLFIGGDYLPRKKKKGDGISHVNMFHCFKIPYFTCTFLQKYL